MKSLVGFCLRRPIAVTAFAALLIVLGLVAYARLPVSLLPDLRYPALVIWTSYPDVPPDQVEQAVTEYLEAGRMPMRLAVPTDAVLVRQGRDLVFRIEEDIAKWIYVTTGPASGNHVEIVEGLQPGDIVAVAGHYSLAHDTLVEITAMD